MLKKAIVLSILFLLVLASNASAFFEITGGVGQTQTQAQPDQLSASSLLNFGSWSENEYTGTRLEGLAAMVRMGGPGEYLLKSSVSGFSDWDITTPNVKINGGNDKHDVIVQAGTPGSISLGDCSINIRADNVELSNLEITQRYDYPEGHRTPLVTVGSEDFPVYFAKFENDGFQIGANGIGVSLDKVYLETSFTNCGFWPTRDQRGVGTGIDQHSGISYINGNTWFGGLKTGIEVEAGAGFWNDIYFIGDQRAPYQNQVFLNPTQDGAVRDLYLQDVSFDFNNHGVAIETNGKRIDNLKLINVGAWVESGPGTFDFKNVHGLLMDGGTYGLNSQEYGIRFTDCENVDIKGATFTYDRDVPALEFNNVNGLTFTENTIKEGQYFHWINGPDHTNPAIKFTGDTKDVLFSVNKIKGDVEFAGSLSDALIYGNKITGELRGTTGENVWETTNLILPGN